MLRLSFLVALLAVAGCQVEDSANTLASDTLAVAVPAVPVELPDTTAAVPGACMLVAQDSVALYARPSVASARFGTLAPGDSVPAAGRAPGFVGVAPGTAQAANVGPFRLRYASADGPFALRGACADLPPQPRLDPTACYEMAMGEVRMHARPDTASDVVATIPPQGFAVATRRTPTGWTQVRLGEAGTPGWVAPEDVNVSGEACESL